MSAQDLKEAYGKNNLRSAIKPHTRSVPRNRRTYRASHLAERSADSPDKYRTCKTLDRTCRCSRTLSENVTAWDQFQLTNLKMKAIPTSLAEVLNRNVTRRLNLSLVDWNR